MFRFQGVLLGGLGVLWLSAMAVGFLTIERYAATPGKSADILSPWPHGTSLALDSSKPTLLMFAHPHCPCTRASLEELNRIIAGFPGKAAVRVVFTVPANAEASWYNTSLYQDASASPWVTAVMDKGGEEAARFGVHTSGDVLLFDPRGARQFDGGITAARGHEGDNGGRDAVEHILKDGTDHPLTFPVFGCGLVRAGETD